MTHQEIVKKYMPMAYKEAQRHLATTSMSREDIQAEALLGLTDAASKFDEKKSKTGITPYLAIRIRWHMIYAVRKDRYVYDKGEKKYKARRKEQPIDNEILQIADEKDNEERWIQSALVHAAFKALDEKERYIIEQKYYRDRKDREIGERIGLSRQRVRELRARALQKMRSSLGGMPCIA